MSLRGKFAVVLAVVSGLLVAASPASATTFCVPAYFGTCTDNGSNQVRSTLSAAMTDNGSDGTADQVFVAPGTLTETGSIAASGTDPLTVTGAGADQTEITTSATGNIIVLLLQDRSGMKMSDLTLVVPASLQDSAGSGVQIRNAEIENVDVEIRNDRSDAFGSMLGNNTISNVRVFGTGASPGFAFQTNGAQPGTTTITGATVTNARYGFATDLGTTIEVRKSQIRNPQLAGMRVRPGSQILLENSVIFTTDATALSVYSQSGVSDLAHLTVRSSTIVARDTNADPAIDIQVPEGSDGDAQVDITNSIIRDYDYTWQMTAPAGPGEPTATLNVDHSNFPATSPEGSVGTANVDDPSNIDQDPLFVTNTNYRLQQGSPSIDAGDPGTAAPLEDFDGTTRPLDGDQNGSSITDQGAFEFTPTPTCETDESLCPPPTCETDPSLCPPPADKLAPKVTALKFTGKKMGSRTVTFRVSENATVKAVLTPVPKKAKNGKKRKGLTISRRAKKGLVKVSIPKRKLKPGKYRLQITATDLAGNRSKPVTRIVRAQ